MAIYLNTEDAAAYLGIKERKLYELVANAAVPCSKVTGKWLFPRDALDRWIESGLAHPAGYRPQTAPPIIGGSHDPLLEWAARRSASGLALLSEGSGAGLLRLDANEVAMAAIHCHDGSPDGSGNVAALAAMPRLGDAVLIAFARREQGLLVARGNPHGLTDLTDVAARHVRLGLRPPAAGASLLLEQMLARAGLGLSDMLAPGAPYATGQDLAFAVRSGEIDCGIATRAVARANGVEFVPLVWESFDLAMRRRDYFEPGPQKLLAFMREGEFRQHADLLGGYDVTLAGTVRANR